jgi:adenosylcobinamide-GDP ribazoletransferase
MRGFIGAVSLLTRVPVRADPDTTRTTAWLPVVGVLNGAAVAGVYVGMRAVTPSLVAATVAVTVGIALTGALHEDGLADVADAFGAGVDRARTLETLRDPRHGTYGVLALVVGVVVRIAALAALDVPAALVAVPAAHGIARAAATGAMVVIRPARADGMGAAYATGKVGAVAGGAVVCAAAIVATGPWALAAAAIGAVAAVAFSALAIRKVGGFTGDVLGAIEQVTEGGVLLLAAAWAPGLLLA